MRRQTAGQLIRRLRESHRWSQATLAREACRAAGLPLDSLTRQDIYRYEKGQRTPRDWLPFIAAALGIPIEELKSAAAVKPEEASPTTLADFLPEGDPLAPLAARTGRRIGSAAVTDLAQRAHGLRLADDVLAGGDLIAPALRELRSAVRLYREGTYTDSVGRGLLIGIGELTQIAGWIASDAGRHDEAERIYRLGLSAAYAANDSTLSANLLGSLGYQRINIGDIREGLSMARTAQHQAETAPPRARALYFDRVAWAQARAQDAQAAMSALGAAGEALAEHADEDEPGYLYWVDADELHIMEARVYTELRRPLRAVPLLTAVLSRYNATHTRELALYLSWLAVAYADANEPEAAAETAERVITLSSDVASERTAERVRVVLGALERFRNVPQVGALLRAAD
ncbi:helix-turn-helix domain-containing protein [Yinghuangia soli]|uniref:Helix-turn-helix domain-containing protein n=1 Tax=Yinghuangia soli TaxID=2908204 RepID=A0AA41PYA6_9ACTN|nr:helix-turn-helix domain-containing protein [Yinghuangia soli]MCF2527049.1 helix-turn-helix domain-containing protein [Yinghuangia soli]